MERKDKKYSILNELTKGSGYDIALMTTFNFEISYFERAVFNRLFAKNIKTISLFVDSDELARSLNEFDAAHNGCHMGRKYMVNPVKIKGAFHPKVILLLGEKRARLFVGSANIKTSGYGINNEVFNFIDYDGNHPEYLDVIVAAVNFFDSINKISYQLDNAVLQAAKNYVYYHKAKENGKVFLLHNIRVSMLDQVKGIVSGNVESICIAVPYYDKELLALQQIESTFPNARISIYVQNKNSTFSMEHNLKKHIVEDIHVFGEIQHTSSFSSGNFYHGKAFLFKIRDKAFMLYGSANCTLSAMSMTHTNGGNVECDFLEVGGTSDFDYFFDALKIVSKEEFSSQPMIYDSQAQSEFIFKYGTVKERIELHIACNKQFNENSLLVRLGDFELEYECFEGEIVVYVSEECQDLLTDIFDISISFGQETETVRCWTYDPIALASSREVQNRDDNLGNFEIDSTGEKYIEDRMKFLKAEATCLNEVQEYKNNLKYMNQIQLEMEEESEDGDFIVDYQIPEEYRLAYRQYNATTKIRNLFVQRFLDGNFTVGLDSYGEKGKSYQQLDGEVSNFVRRKATKEEVKFENFIKGKVKGMMNETYAEVIELQHYIGLVQVVLEIFEKYSGEEGVEDIFNPDYVVLTKIGFMKRIIGKNLDDVPDRAEIQAAIIKKCIQTILEVFLFYRGLEEQDEKMKYDSANKDLLKTLEQNFKVRSTYKSVVKQLMKKARGKAASLGYDGACDYIEQLYGYKTFEMICELINKAYPGAEVSSVGSTMKIHANTEAISKCLNLNTDILKEIANYSRNTSKISMVYFEFASIAPNPEKKNVIKKINHSVNMDYHQWKCTETRANGDRHDSKSQYLSF